MSIKVRPMTLDDLEAVLENERRSYTHPWSHGIFTDCVNAGHECWVLDRDGQLIGHIVLSVAAGEPHLQNVCVNPEWQGHGLGRKLVDFILQRARSHKVNQVFLEVRPSNLVAYKLYESMGFNEIGVRPNYYPAPNGREDAIVFAMELLY